MSRSKPGENPKSALLGDLESIRTLLDDDDTSASSPVLDDIEVPVLEDIVDQPADPAGAPAEHRGLDNDLFRALLSDEWRESANVILKQAREVINTHGGDWTAEESDTLNDALKLRIDQTMQGWMRGMVVTHMADLHEVMRRALSEELGTTIEKIIDQRNEASDGK